MPMPPSQWLNCLHMRIERSSASTSVRTVAPVAVNPETASKYALTGLASWSTPPKKIGQGTERRHEQPRKRNREKALARPEPVAGRCEALAGDAGERGEGSGRQEGPDRLAVAERHRRRKEERSPQILQHRADEAESCAKVNPEAESVSPALAGERNQS